MRRGRIALLLGFLLPPLPAVVAAPLDKAACDKLKAEQAELEQQGVRVTTEKGAQWAKANLKPEQLDQIRHIIDVDGQLLFRCNGRPLVALPKDVEAEPQASDAGEARKKPPPEKRAPDAAAAKPEPQPLAKAAVGNGKPPVAHGKRASAVAKVAGQHGSAKSPHAVSGAAPKAKPKVDDAFKPPPSDPDANPFANQAPPEPKN